MNMYYKIRLIGIILLIIMSLFACDRHLGNLKNSRIKSIDIGIKNNGSKILLGAYVKFGEHSFTTTIISPNKYSAYLYFEHFYASKEVEVYYKFKDAPPISRLISTEGIISSDMVGDVTIFFEVSDSSPEIKIGVYKFAEIGGKTEFVLIKSYLR